MRLISPPFKLLRQYDKGAKGWSVTLLKNNSPVLGEGCGPSSSTISLNEFKRLALKLIERQKSFDLRR